MACLARVISFSFVFSIKFLGGINYFFHMSQLKNKNLFCEKNNYRPKTLNTLIMLEISKNSIMLGINHITHEVNKKSKINSVETTKKVLTTFLETIQQKLVQGENINFKGYFTLKRSTTKPKGSKHCNKHEKSLTDFKQTNKGKGVQFYAKSAKFRSLVGETRNCKDCQGKKQQLIKSAKPTNRISFKVSKGF